MVQRNFLGASVEPQLAPPARSDDVHARRRGQRRWGFPADDASDGLRDESTRTPRRRRRAVGPRHRHHRHRFHLGAVLRDPPHRSRQLELRQRHLLSQRHGHARRRRVVRRPPEPPGAAPNAPAGREPDPRLHRPARVGRDPSQRCAPSKRSPRPSVGSTRRSPKCASRDDLDDQTKQIMARNLEEVENRRLDVLKTNIDAEKGREVRASEERMESQIRRIQSRHSHHRGAAAADPGVPLGCLHLHRVAGSASAKARSPLTV